MIELNTSNQRQIRKIIKLELDFGIKTLKTLKELKKICANLEK